MRGVKGRELCYKDEEELTIQVNEEMKNYAEEVLSHMRYTKFTTLVLHDLANNKDQIVNAKELEKKGQVFPDRLLRYRKTQVFRKSDDRVLDIISDDFRDILKVF